MQTCFTFLLYRSFYKSRGQQLHPLPTYTWTSCNRQLSPVWDKIKQTTMLKCICTSHFKFLRAQSISFRSTIYLQIRKKKYFSQNSTRHTTRNTQNSRRCRKVWSVRCKRSQDQQYSRSLNNHQPILKELTFLCPQLWLSFWSVRYSV